MCCIDEAKLIIIFSSTAVLALAFVPLKSEGVTISAIRFHFNMYTGPGYLSVLLAFVNIILVVAVFRDYKINSKREGRVVMKGMRTFDTSKRGNGELILTSRNVSLRNREIE